MYYDALKENSNIEISIARDTIQDSNGHVFFIKCRDLEHRQKITKTLKEQGISAYFHYVPLHSARAGLKYGSFHHEDNYTTKESERLLRLPMYSTLTEIERVVSHL